MTLNNEIIVVSGLPRSGTSLMMSMLDRGGIRILTDEHRPADTDNPRGYYELERVKQLKDDCSWIHDARGTAVKVVSPLLYDLPAEETYRIIFMERDLEEVIASQEKMLQRRGQAVPPSEKIRAAFELHLERLFDWIPKQPHLTVMRVNYNELMTNANAVIEEVAGFVRQPIDTVRMQEAIDPTLYRNRGSTAG